MPAGLQEDRRRRRRDRTHPRRLRRHAAPFRPPRPRRGRASMFTRPTPGVDPCWSAMPTIAQSCARRTNFWKLQPAPVAFGKRISVRSSSSPTAVSRKPVKKSSAVIVRVPEGPVTTIVARASATAGRSEAGSPWASEPPIVPRLRTCGSPTRWAACPNRGRCSASSGSRSRSRWRVSAPIATTSPSSRM